MFNHTLMKIKSQVAENLYRPINWLTILLLPFSFIFFCIVNIRRALYRFNLLKTTKFNVPIIVIGNITVGGTGKTPIVMWLANSLINRGRKVGIVSRGYAATSSITQPISVTPSSDVHLVGDEALLMSLHCHCPIVVCADRAAAVKKLVTDFSVDLVICDDGLQHFALGRDIEIVVIDSKRKFGNGFYLPAGPLRESISRLNTADLVLYQDTDLLHYVPGKLTAVSDFQSTKSVDDFKKLTVHAVAGIGNPNRFFEMLKNQGIHVIEHAYDDHHNFQKSDITFKDNNFVIMTEKDAVKCRSFADEHHWFLPIDVYMDQSIQENILQICDINKE